MERSVNGGRLLQQRSAAGRVRVTSTAAAPPPAAAGWRQARAGCCGLVQQAAGGWLERRSCVAARSFNFADAGVPERTGRKNRTVEKGKAQEVLAVVRGLCRMSSKQLAAVSHLMTEQQLKELGIATRIPPTNQGRKRQENLVAKLLRNEMDEAALSKLASAVELALRNNLPFVDLDLEQQLEVWVEGLVRGDEDVMQEVLLLCQDAGLDWSAVRTWARQAQQQQQQQQQEEAARQPTGAAGAGGAAAAGGAGEGAPGALTPSQVQQQQQEEQQRRQQQQAAMRGANNARKALRRALRPLALGLQA